MMELQMDVSVDLRELYDDLAEMSQDATEQACAWGHARAQNYECPLMQNRAEVLEERYTRLHQRLAKERSRVFFLMRPVVEQPQVSGFYDDAFDDDLPF